MLLSDITRLKLSPGDAAVYRQIVDQLLPKSDSVLPGYLPSRRGALIPDKNDPLVNLLKVVHEIENNYIQLKQAMSGDVVSNEDYTPFIEPHDPKVQELAASITNPEDDNDTKAYKVMSWVQDNVQYQDDFVNYGEGEYWARPTETLGIMSGDCEDGAFLEHSLMLAADVPWERIRTYGGFVVAGQGAALGGHGWTAYQRESDDQWVVMDWCYYPTKNPVSERTPMTADNKYIDDFFYVNEQQTIETPFTNRVRTPESQGRLMNMYA